jgi:hypothetical protein
MNWRRTSGLFFLLLFAFSFCSLRTIAQDEPQQQPQQPPPDMPQQPAPDDNNPQPEEPFPGGPPKPAGFAFPGLLGPGEGELQADFSPLTGIQNPTLGYPEFRHSYLAPGLQYSSTVASAPVGGSGTDWYALNYFLGNLSFLDSWGKSMLAINYSGGSSVATNSSVQDGYYQQLALAQTFRYDRWLIQIVDSFVQSPQSSFGFGGGTGLGIPGVGGGFGTTIPGLGGSYVPNQSIYGVGPFINNVGAVQLTYALTRRGSITVAGSYGILHFTKPGNIDSNTLVGAIGYNYALTRNDTIGVVYRYEDFQFPGSPQAYVDHVVSLAYGRKVTGRIGLRIFAGPEFTIYRVPIGTATRSTGFSASAHLTYRFERGTLGLGYEHGLYGGSGVLIGSVLDQATATYSRGLSRLWSGNLFFGYARNSPVGGTTASGYPNYSNWFAGGGVARPFGKYLHFGVSYTATIGDYAGYGCTGPACSTSNTTYNTVTVNLQWRPKPYALK